MARALILVVLLATGSNVAAQIYRWTDEQGRVHYGEQLPSGQKADSVTFPGQGNATVAPQSGRTIQIPMRPLTPEEAERERRLQEAADREMRERDERENAALLRNPAVGAYFCPRIDQAIQNARAQGNAAAVREIEAEREKYHCR